MNAQQVPSQPSTPANGNGVKVSRGRLKIFFGAASGVGKTQAMLEAACKEANNHTDVVVGYIETRLWSETEALLQKLEVLPRRHISYGGSNYSEFDLDATLSRHPELILIDNLAHINAPGVRHARRWQDVQELLNAGIHVYTTLSVQHVESLGDVVSQITGITLSETIPDLIFDQADEVELVDVSPDALLERFQEGKIYLLPEL